MWFFNPRFADFNFYPFFLFEYFQFDIRKLTHLSLASSLSWSLWYLSGCHFLLSSLYLLRISLWLAPFFNSKTYNNRILETIWVGVVQNLNPMLKNTMQLSWLKYLLWEHFFLQVDQDCQLVVPMPTQSHVPGNVHTVCQHFWRILKFEEKN